MKLPNCPTTAAAANSDIKEEIAVNTPMNPAAYTSALRIAQQLAPCMPAFEAAMRAQRVAQDSPAVMDLATNQALIHTQTQLAAVSSPVMAAVAAAQAQLAAVSSPSILPTASPTCSVLFHFCKPAEPKEYPR